MMRAMSTVPRLARPSASAGMTVGHHMLETGANAEPYQLGLVIGFLDHRPSHIEPQRPEGRIPDQAGADRGPDSRILAKDVADAVGAVGVELILLRRAEQGSDIGEDGAFE